MTKMEAYRYCQNHGAGFVANVVLTRHRNPAKKLCAMVQLLKAGSTVTLAPFDIDTLLVDGKQVSWQALEQEASLIEHAAGIFDTRIEAVRAAKGLDATIEPSTSLPGKFILYVWTVKKKRKKNS